MPQNLYQQLSRATQAGDGQQAAAYAATITTQLQQDNKALAGLGSALIRDANQSQQRQNLLTLIELLKHKPAQIWHLQKQFWEARDIGLSKVLLQTLAETEQRPQALYWLGNLARIQGADTEAVKYFQAALELQPDLLDCVLSYAFLLREQGQTMALEKLLLEFTNQPDLTIQQLGQVLDFLHQANAFTAALKIADKIRAREPNNSALLLRIGRLQHGLGEFDAAAEAFTLALQADPQLGPAWLHLAQIQDFSEQPGETQAAMQTSLEQAAADSETALCLHFALGKVNADKQHWAAAFNHYQQGNRLQRKRQRWDSAAWKQFVNTTLAAKPLPSLSTPQPDDFNMLFIVGMLRSGTTLLEQQLNRHPQIIARGELNWIAHLAGQLGTNPAPAELVDARRWLRRQVIQDQAFAAGSKNLWFVDKNPLNYRYLNLLLTLLPQAKIIHCQRDARASLWSCYCQLFQHRDTAFSSDLDDLLLYYRDYRRLMRHWQSLYPNQIITLDYAELVTEQDQSLRQLFDQLKLPALSVAETTTQTSIIRTASVWQARQPVHTRAIQRWRHYYEFANQFFDEAETIDQYFS